MTTPRLYRFCDHRDLFDEPNWAFRPDAVYELASRRGVTDQSVIEFARWLAWRVPTSEKPTSASPLSAFIVAYRVTELDHPVPTTEQAIAALDLAAVPYAYRQGEIILAVPASVTNTVIRPVHPKWTGALRFAPYVEVTPDKVAKALKEVKHLIDYITPTWEWYDDPLESERARQWGEPFDTRNYDAAPWVLSRRLDHWQAITDFVREWTPTNGRRPRDLNDGHLGGILKHSAENELGFYVAGGDVVLAAQMLGIPMHIDHDLYVTLSTRAEWAELVSKRGYRAAFHGTPRIAVHGRTVPEDYIEEGLVA